jgi:hypothetical protein
MQLTRISLVSKKTTTRDLPITPEQMAAWKAGAFVQDAFPHLSAADREWFLTGIIEEEWRELVGEEEASQ